MNRLALVVTMATSTLIVPGASFLIPNGGRPGDSPLVEVIPPLIMASLLSIVAGYVASRRTHGLPSGALGGALNASIVLGLFLLAATIGDRHFRSIGGPNLFVGLPLAAVAGAGFGAIGGRLRRLRYAHHGAAGGNR